MNSLMEYKGYHAAIEYSAEDHAMIGQIIGINDVLAFDAENVDELEAMFHETIDDYLEMCARTGKDPDKEYKGSFNIRIGSELHKKADLQAKAQLFGHNNKSASSRSKILEKCVSANYNKHIRGSRKSSFLFCLKFIIGALLRTVKKKSLPLSSSRL